MAPHISPLCLPPKGMDMTGVNGWASGWGALQPGSRLRPKTLQVIFKPILKYWSNFGKPKVQKLIDGAILKRTKERGKSFAAPENCVCNWPADASFVSSFCRLWTFQWLKIANANVGTGIRVLTWSSTTKWSAPVTTGAAKTPVRATRVGPWWRKSRGVGPSSALFRPDTHVQNEASLAFTTGWPKPPIGSPTQSTINFTPSASSLCCDTTSHKIKSRIQDYLVWHLTCQKVWQFQCDYSSDFISRYVFSLFMDYFWHTRWRLK